MAEEKTLIVVGGGIRIASHLTAEAKGAIVGADVVLYGLPHEADVVYLNQLNSRCESLAPLYRHGESRDITYNLIVNRICQTLTMYQKVCVVFYGHAGFYVYAGHRAVVLARENGHHAIMLPAVSSLDCLICDLGIDPGFGGCMIFEANEFLFRKIVPITSSCLILLQVGLLGSKTFDDYSQAEKILPELVMYLTQYYNHDFEVIVYEAAILSIQKPKILRNKLKLLAGSDLSPFSTLVLLPEKDL